MEATRRNDLAALWGLLGFTLLLGSAIVRLGALGLDALSEDLGPMHWVVLVAFTAFMAYTEGYRGFQLRFSPRFARRIMAVRESASLLERALAPFYAMGFFRAEPRQILVSYLLTAFIIVLIVLFRTIPQPWRGILDCGVVVGLTYGLVASWACVVAAWSREGASGSGAPARGATLRRGSAVD